MAAEEMIAPRYDHDHLCVDVIAHHGRISASREAVVCGDERLTWAALDRRTNRVANAIRGLGLAKGDKVCMFMPNSIAAFTVFWGVVKAGCVIVPLNIMLEGESLIRLIDASDGRLLFADASTSGLIDAVRDRLEHIAETDFYVFGETRPRWCDARALIDSGDAASPGVKISPQDSMTIIYTSGTTGVPKGIEHSHFGRLNYPYGFGAGLGIDRHSVGICATPVYASGTWITVLPTMYAGGKVVLLPKFTPQAFLDAVERENGTHTFMVPTQYIAILQHKQSDRTCPTLRVLVSAGQSLADATRESLALRFPNARLYEVYGMTEGFFTIAAPGDTPSKPGSVGKPGLLEDIRIIGEDDAEVGTGETGEIVAYGPGMMKGYYNRPDLTVQAIWTSPEGRTFLRSGDLGHFDEQHFLYVSGRKKDMIKSGGINIYAVDLEQVLMSHPDVVEVAVIGVPHPKWSETPIAIVIPRDNHESTEDDLRAWANKKLAKYQRLSKVIFCADMPRATYGKIQKDKLRSEFREIGASL